MVANPAVTRAGDVQSVHRALDLLEAIARQGEYGVTELAQACDLKTSTTHNLLKTMTKRGYLLASDGRYRLGPGMSSITSRFDPALALPAVVRPAIETASRTTQINVLAAILQGDRLRNIGWAGSSSLIYHRSPRQEWEPEATLEPAAGRVLVAMNHRDGWDSFIARAANAEPDWKAEEWTRYLEQIVETGLCVKFDPRSYLALAVPVWAGQQVVICSLACSLPAGMSSPTLMQTILDALWTATTEISGLLGCVELPYAKPRLAISQITAVQRVSGS